MEQNSFITNQDKLLSDIINGILPKSKAMTMNVSKVWVDNDYVHILTDGGQELRERIADYPRLRQASAEALQDYETDRYGISWRTLDEDLCFEYFVPAS